MSIAYIEEPLHHKAQHYCNRHFKKKLEKLHRLLTEVVVTESINQYPLSIYDIDNDIVVVDGGDYGNSPIRPPDGVTWHCNSVLEGIHLHVQDKIGSYCGLNFTCLDGILPFI